MHSQIDCILYAQYFGLRFRFLSGKNLQKKEMKLQLCSFYQMEWPLLCLHLVCR